CNDSWIRDRWRRLRAAEHLFASFHRSSVAAFSHGRNPALVGDSPSAILLLWLNSYRATFRKMRARLEISRRVRKGPPASEIRNGLAARGKTSFAYAVGTMEHCFIEVKRCPSSERRLTLVYSPFCCVLTRCTNSAVASPL